MGKTAIKASRGTIFNLDANGVVIIGLDTKHRSKREHPLWQDRAAKPVDSDLAYSVYHFGVRQAVEVRKNGKSADGSDILEVVYGRQRTKALREANEKRAKAGLDPWPLPARVVSLDDNEANEIMLVENHQRVAVDKISMAIEMREQLALGKDPAYVARALFGCDVQTMERTIALLDLDDEVKAHVQQGRLSAHAAYELRNEPRERQREVARELLGSLAAGVEGDGAPSSEAEAPAEAKKKRGPTAKDVKKKLAEKDGKEAFEKPSKVLLNRILAEWEVKGTKNQIRSTIDQSTIAVIRWVLGKGDKNRVGGLTEVVNYVEEKYAPKKK